MNAIAAQKFRLSVIFMVLAVSVVVFQNCSKDQFEQGSAHQDAQSVQGTVSSNDAVDMVSAMTAAGVQPDVKGGTVYTVDTMICKTMMTARNAIICTFKQGLNEFSTSSADTIRIRNRLYVMNVRTACAASFDCSTFAEALLVSNLKCRYVPTGPAQSSCAFLK